MGIISSIKTLGQCQDHLGPLNNSKLFQRYSELASLIDSLVIFYQVMVLSGFSTQIEEHSMCGYFSYALPGAYVGRTLRLQTLMSH